MRVLGSVKLRIFLVAWVVFSVHFSTNIVREHYPAFALIENGNFVCDRYEGFHADIFEHTDGHDYVCNNVMGSVVAAVPLLVFDPVLDALEAHSKRKLEASGGNVDSSFDSKHPISRMLFKRVREEGLDLRFGASAAVTSVFLMAPLSAFLTVLLFSALLARGVPRPRATWLAFLFAFGTPVFLRTAHLSHNLFLMAATFGAFLLLWAPGRETYEVSLRRRLGAGFLCGMAFALDYAGAIPAAALWAYFVVFRRPAVGMAAALKESAALVLGSLPCVLFLLGTQWAMYGDPFTPAQFVMPAVNFTDQGLSGLTWPTPEAFTKNLLSPSWGLVPYAPLLVLAFLSSRKYEASSLVLSRADRRWVWAFTAAFLLFCAANQYSLMQFNTGFRYLLPLVPFLFLAASDHLSRWSTKALAWVTVPVLAHSWILAMARELSDVENDLRRRAIELGVSQFSVPGYWGSLFTETNVPLSYRRIFSEGLQLPWLRILQSTPLGEQFHLASPFAPYVILAAVGGVCLWIWRIGARVESAARAG